MSERPETLLSAVRALVVRELVSRHGLRKSEVAKVLGISPASVTQYLSKSRGAYLAERIQREDPALHIIKLFAENVARRARLGVEVFAGPELTELVMEVSKVMRGLAPLGRDEGQKTTIIKALVERLRLEELAARKALEVASKSGDELVRSMLRQIATDSLRHADIVSTLIQGLESGNWGGSTPPERRLIEELATYEQEAEESSLQDVIKMLNNPVAKALLNSIEMDERKHSLMLSSLVRSMKEENG